MRQWIFIGLILAAGGYFFYEARGVIFAPTLEIFTPEEDATVGTARLQVSGRTDPYLKVWISGREAQADGNGFFFDAVPVWPGYNALGIRVADKFGNETSKILKVVVK